MRSSAKLLGVCALACLLSPALRSQDVAAAAAETPKLQSIGPIAFGPKHTLFVSDPRAAMIYAFEIGHLKGEGIGDSVEIAGVDTKIAGLLGTEAQQVQVVDVAIHPETSQVYLAVNRGRGANATPVLVTLGAKDKLSAVSLEGIKFSKCELKNAPPAQPANRGGQAAGRGGQRGQRGGQQRGRRGQRGGRRGRRNQRLLSITDMAFVDGRVIVAGLSNEEFSSRLRALPYPFTDTNPGAGIEIFHGAHGRYETNAPVRTFTPYFMGGNQHLLCAYTCTPLVIFPLSALEPGKKVKGKTIAELGNRNNPIDMIVYDKDGEDFLLMNNSSRGVMKIPTKGLETAESLTERVGGGGTAGVGYETIKDLKSVEQLAKLNKKTGLILFRTDDGVLTLKTIDLP